MKAVKGRRETCISVLRTHSFSRLLRRIAGVIRRGKTFFLAGHLSPDGDTLGCSLALASVLRRMGKHACIYSSDPVPENLRFMPGIKSIHVGKLPKRDFDVMILLECSNPKRAGDLKNLAARTRCLINIDHHRTAEAYGDINLIDPFSSSTAELIYQLFGTMKVRITAMEATYLYVGIVTDTGRFQYPATRPRTLETAARLIEAGARASHVNDRIYCTKVFPALKLLGRALEKLQLLDSGRAAVSVLNASDFANASASSQHTEDIVNYGLMIPGVIISVLFREEKDIIAVNFRSKGRLDVSALAKRFGGGGHRNAAGCKLKTSLENAKKMVIKALTH